MYLRVETHKPDFTLIEFSARFPNEEYRAFLFLRDRGGVPDRW
jgi:hypothetical protein